MIVRGFRPVAWVAAIGGAALGCYMLSLQVAAERAELAGVERQIVLARQDIRALQTELGTRGRLQQLEQWNAEVLALAAPVAGQFLESNLSLARFDARQRGIGDHADIRLASAAAPTTQPIEAPVRLASAEVPSVSAEPSAVADRPLIRRASLDTLPAAAPVRATVAARAVSLLDEGTIVELRDQAQSEREGRARN